MLRTKDAPNKSGIWTGTRVQRDFDIDFVHVHSIKHDDNTEFTLNFEQKHSCTIRVLRIF